MSNYNKLKVEADNRVVVYLMNRLLTPIEQSPAYKDGTIDEFGSRIKKPTTDEANVNYTLLDKLTLALKSSISEDRLEEMLEPYMHMAFFDPVFVDSKGASYTFRKAKKAFNQLYDIVMSPDYLPDGIIRDDVLDDTDISSDDVRYMLTMLSVMMTTLRKSSVPNKSEYRDIIYQVEDTFGFYSDDTMIEPIITKLIDNNLISGTKLTSNGLHLLTKCSKIIDENNLTLDKDTIHNQNRQWSFLVRAGI